MEYSHHLGLTGVAIIIGLAAMAGIGMVKIKQPAVIGYIFVGLILGPGGFELVKERNSIELFAELGIILLLYFIGLELHLQSFLQLWRKTIVVAIAQIMVSVGACIFIGSQFGFSIHLSIVFGFCLALSSTAVAVRLVDNLGEKQTKAGQLTIGILIAQDLAVAPMLLIIGGLSGETFSILPLLEAIVAIGIMGVVIFLLSRNLSYSLPFHVFWTSRSELAPLCGIAWCFLIASISGVINFSPAFGAFLAGIIAGNSKQNKIVVEQAGPIQAVLLMMFFLSMGMLIDLRFIWQNSTLILSLLTIVMLFKTVLNVLVLRLQKESWQNSLLSSLMLGQMGEFSLVLATAAYGTHLITETSQKTIIAVTVLSLVISPIYIDAIRRLNHRSIKNKKEFGKIVFLIYSREWRFTRKSTQFFWKICLTHIDRMYYTLEKARKHIQEKRHKDHEHHEDDEQHDHTKNT